MGPQEDYIETVFTCEGDFHDPHLKDRLEDFQKSLKDLLLTDKSKLILKKVEPWNSVRVTFKIPQEAALRLKQLAQQGNSTLRELGVLAVQIQDQNISLTIAGRNNEHTQLVFRTADSSKDNTSSLSVYGKHAPLLDEVGPQGLGPTHLETTSKNIVNYLQKGPPALLDLFSQHATGEKVLGPHCDGARVKINNILSEHGSEHKSFQEAATQSGYDHFGQASSLYVNCLNPNRDPVGQAVLKFPQVPGMPPVCSPGLVPGPSKQQHHALDNLLPPPPYLEGSSYLNNLQKLHLGSPNISPRLKNDPNLSSLLAGRHTPTLDSDTLQPPKKKRKPRKPNVKKKGDLHSATCIPNVGGISDPCAEAISMSSHLAPAVTTSSVMDLKSNLTVSEHVFKTVPQAVMHNTHVETKSEQIVLLSSIATQGRFDECDTTGKIINPVTGLLEPRENFSDTSPAKSDSGKQSPHPVVQGVTENSFQSSIKEGMNVVGYPVRLLSPNQSSQRQKSDQTNLSPGHMFSCSSQFESSAACDWLHQKHLEEAAKLEMVQKTLLKNDILPLLSIVEQTLYSASKHSGIVERKCDNTGNDDLQGTKENNEKRKEVMMPQEMHTQSIPFQLLNKPLLQVKHDYWTGKPSGSSDRYGDSKISTQSLSLDTHNISDQSGAQMDPKMYNNDSGVGSCSERSDDTPSEPGDNDYKSGITMSVECTKPSINEPLKQVLPNSNIVSVGYSVKETQMDIKNHRSVAPFLGSDKLLYSSLDKTKFKEEKLAMCPTSHTPHSNWTLDGYLGMANNVDPVTQAVHNSTNLNGPKLSTSLPKSVHHVADGQLSSMQGHTVPLSMQKKKASPRNSPRNFSPRNPSSPRNTCSPRGSSCSSPRTGDPIIAGISHQEFLELSSQILGRESQNKSPFSDQSRSLHSEQRKSPYSMSDSHSPYSSGMLNLGIHMNSAEARVDRNHVGMESVTSRQQQCNNDASFLKSLEAARQLNILASTKDANFLPLFHKIQQMNMIHSMTNGVDNFNRNDNVTHASRSPDPSVPLPKTHEPNTNVMDVHTDGSAVHNCMLSGPLLNVQSSSNSDMDNSNHKTNSKGSKLHSEELKGATNSSSRRSSPGTANNTSSSLHQSFNSTLPQPKRLTESVQKLLTLPLLDTSLPRVNCRSPANSASGTKLTSSTTGTQCIANSRESEQTPVLTLSRNPNEDAAHIDLDSITPSITGFGFEPIDFHVDMSNYSYMDINNTEHSCLSSFIENHPVSVSCPNAVSLFPTKLVPVHTGVITSYEAGESFSSLKNDHGTYTREKQNGSNVQIPVASEAGVCNSERKMAVNSVLASRTFSSHVYITQVCPSISQPLNDRYTVQRHFEQPKNLFQEMGLSARLQVTANIHLLTRRLPPFVPKKCFIKSN